MDGVSKIREEELTPLVEEFYARVRADPALGPIFNDAIDDWLAGGRGLVACLACGADNGLNDWDWGYPWEFGALGVTAWNWDELSPDFITQVSEVLGGHRVIHCSYKI